MQEDNIYRRQTVPQAVPLQQEEAADKERLQVLDEYPLIKAVIERLNADIAFYDSNQGIPDDVLLNPDEFMHTVAGNKKAVASIEREIRVLEELVTEHIAR